MEVLADNEKLMKQQHDLKHALEVQKLAAERAKRCNEELEKYLKMIVEQYFDLEDPMIPPTPPPENLPHTATRRNNLQMY